MQCLLLFFSLLQAEGTEMEALGQIKGTDGTISAAHSLDFLHNWEGFFTQPAPLPQTHKVN